MVYDPYMAGDIITAEGLNDATLKTLELTRLTGVATYATTSGTTELNVAVLSLGPHAMKAVGLYGITFITAASNSVATDTYTMQVRRDTALTGTVVASKLIYAAPATTIRQLSVELEFEPPIDATSEFFVSFVRTSGSGTLTLTRSANTFIQLERLGYAADAAAA